MLRAQRSLPSSMEKKLYSTEQYSAEQYSIVANKCLLDGYFTLRRLRLFEGLVTFFLSALLSSEEMNFRPPLFKTWPTNHEARWNRKLGLEGRGYFRYIDRAARDKEGNANVMRGCGVRLCTKTYKYKHRTNACFIHFCSARLCCAPLFTNDVFQDLFLIARSGYIV